MDGMGREPERKRPEQPDQVRKPYRRPQVIAYGDIATLTQAQATSGTDAALGKSV